MMKFLNHLEEWIITTLMGAATLVIFVAVVHRYASGLAIPGVQDALIKINMSWAQEVCIYMFVWMAKFGAAYGVRTGIHVGVDVLINRLGDSKRAKLVVFGLLAGALFTGIVGTLGARFVWEIAHTEQVSADLEDASYSDHMVPPSPAQETFLKRHQVGVMGEARSVTTRMRYLESLFEVDEVITVYGIVRHEVGPEGLRVIIEAPPGGSLLVSDDKHTVRPPMMPSSLSMSAIR